MSDIQSAVHGLQFMQHNAQSALPVIPNNGNPAGAYNMPAAPAGATAPTPVAKPTLADRYPWLAPSQSMQNIRGMLDARRQQPVQMPMPVMPTQRF